MHLPISLIDSIWIELHFLVPTDRLCNKSVERAGAMLITALCQCKWGSKSHKHSSWRNKWLLQFLQLTWERASAPLCFITRIIFWNGNLFAKENRLTEHWRNTLNFLLKKLQSSRPRCLAMLVQYGWSLLMV